MGKFSQTFVAYHGCGNYYQDSTNKIIPKNRKCAMQTYNSFWKKPIDVCNRVETRAQLKTKTKASSEFQLRYQKWVNLYSKDSFTSSGFDSDSDSDPDSNINSDNESLANNASETEQNLSDNETNDKLIIYNNTAVEQTLSISNNSSKNLSETSGTANNK